jgi:hypothetical protein
VSSLATRRRGPLVVAVLAALAHLVVGFFYLAGGLVVPGYVLIPLWIVWIVLAAVLVRLAMRESWWTPAVPLGAPGAVPGGDHGGRERARLDRLSP